MNITVEINRELHKLQYAAFDKSKVCSQCSLLDACVKEAKTSYRPIHYLCDLTDAGFRKVKKEAK